MIRSMTGFGKAESHSSEFAISLKIEISSVNRKQLEVKVSLPKEMGYYENIVRRTVPSHVTRGSISVRVDTALQENGLKEGSLYKAKVNEDFAAGIIKAAEALGKKFGIDGRISVKDILAIPGLVETGSADYSSPEFEEIFTSALKNALDAFNQMRCYEGGKLKDDIRSRIASMRNVIKEVEPLAKEIPQLLKAKLLQKMSEEKLDIPDNDERILKEMIIYCDRSDVSEEITRLYSHFDHFENFLDSDSETNPGRSLDFLVQETFRELTTLGNKAGNSVISPKIVMLKTELEKIREQIQNIE